MNHQALLVFFRINLPHFFDANSVVLGILALVQPKVRYELFAEMAATTLCKYGVFGVKLHTGDVAVLLFAVRANTHLASRDALHRSCVIKQDFRRGKSRVDLDAHAFSLFGKPPADIAHRHDVVAVVVRGARNREAGQLDRAGLPCVEVKRVAGHGGIERGATLLPIGE